MVDPTITRQGDTFTIRIENEDYRGYRRRTVVFPCGGTGVPVIKEQYLRCLPGDEILEKNILERVHDPEEMAGVV